MLQALGQILIDNGLQDYTLPVYQTDKHCTTIHSNYFPTSEVCTTKHSIVGFEPHPDLFKVGICSLLTAYAIDKVYNSELWSQLPDYNYDVDEEKVDEPLYKKQQEEIKCLFDNKSKILEKNNNCSKLIDAFGALSTLESKKSMLYYNVKERILNQINEIIIRNEIAKNRWFNYLVFSNCCLTRFPSELFNDPVLNLKELYILHLDNNHLTSLPKEIGQCKKLEVLNISNNKFTSLPDSIEECKALTDFHCSGNQLTCLPDYIGEWKRLMFLRASRNKLSSLPNSIGECKELKEISVDSNQLTYLPKTINECKKLREIDIVNNQFNSMSGFSFGVPFMNRCSKIVRDVKTDSERFFENHNKYLQLQEVAHKLCTTRKFS